MDTQYVQIQITTDNIQESEHLIHLFISHHLVASVQVIPKISSTYIWNDRICTKEENLLLLHTMIEHLDTIYKILEQEHSYSVPEYIVLPIIHGSNSYLEWIRNNVQT